MPQNEFINSGNVHKAQLHPWLTDGSGNVVDVNGNVLAFDQYGSLNGISYAHGAGTDGTAPSPTRYAILDPHNVDNTPYGHNLKYYDHFKQVFQKGNTTNNSIRPLRVQPKKPILTLPFPITIPFTPIMQNGSVDRTNLSVNIGTELFKGFKIRTTTQVVYTRNNLLPGLGAAGGQYYGQGNSLGNIGTVYGFLNTSPFFDLKAKLADGTYPAYQQAGGFLSVNAFNPFYDQEYSTGLDNKIDIIQNFNANYKVNKFIELDAKYGINYRNETARWTYYNQSQNINSNYYQDWAGFQGGPTNAGEIDDFRYATTFQEFFPSVFVRTDFEDDFHIKLPIQTSTQVSFDYRSNKYSEYDTYGLGLSLTPPINLQNTGSQAVILTTSSRLSPTVIWSTKKLILEISPG